MESKHIQAEKDYVKGMKYKDLAEKNGVSINTIKSWKKRHGWERKKGAHKKGGQPGNVNALGNSGAQHQYVIKTQRHTAYTQSTCQLKRLKSCRTFCQFIYFGSKFKFNSQPLCGHRKNKDEMSKELKKKKSVVSDSTDIEEEEYEFQSN